MRGGRHFVLCVPECQLDCHERAVQASSTMVPLATDIPTDTPYPTPTIAPTDTMEPSPTPFSTPVPFPNTLFKDNFSSVSTGWDQEHDANYILEYKNGSYHFVVNAKNGGQSVWHGDGYTNVSVEVDATVNAGPQDGMVGVSCRYTNNVGGYTLNMPRTVPTGSICTTRATRMCWMKLRWTRTRSVPAVLRTSRASVMVRL